MQTMQMASRAERSFFIVNTSLKIKLRVIWSPGMPGSYLQPYYIRWRIKLQQKMTRQNHEFWHCKLCKLDKCC